MNNPICAACGLEVSEGSGPCPSDPDQGILDWGLTQADYQMLSRQLDISDQIAWLTEARDLISDRKRWCQGSRAKDTHGRIVEPNSPDAVKWCATGAICKVLNLEYIDPRHIARLHRKALQRMVGSIETYNDSRSHKQVLAIFDETIEDLKHSLREAEGVTHGTR